MAANTIARLIASACDARLRCIRENNHEWHDKHENFITLATERYLPHGSGFDNGTTFDFGASTGEKLVFHTSYHHMDENEMYDGWTEHTVTVRASLIFGIDVRIGGKNRNDIKEYIAEMFSVLSEVLTDEQHKALCA